MRVLTARAALCLYFGTMNADRSNRSTGMALKVARTQARVKANQVAREMGVSPSRVAAIEREAIVTPAAAARYLAALEQCRTVGTEAA